MLMAIERNVPHAAQKVPISSKATKIKSKTMLRINPVMDISIPTPGFPSVLTRYSKKQLEGHGGASQKNDKGVGKDMREQTFAASQKNTDGL